ncbi:MAG: hypothetical protein IKW28_08215 [Lachnospiraceae bacterium]|nr:hypothetical protein [Lachnospiraceae bacterium]
MKKYGKMIGILTAAAVCIFLGIFSGRKILTVMGEEKPTITFGEFSKKNTIEDSVLLIGTHLIHIQSMTDALYEMAVDSGSESEQTMVYYKSELADGAWFDITDALGLADISEEGIVVTSEDMKDVKLEYYTFKDGITRSALTGNPINIFNIREPYDLYQLEELEQLRQQFEQQFSEEDTGVKKYYYDKLKAFFEQDVRNDTTAECDRQLNALQEIYIGLQTSDKKDLAEIVSKIMGKIDAKRRAEVLYALSQSENHLLNKLQELCTGSEYLKEDYILKIEIPAESTEDGDSEDGEENTEDKEKQYEYEKEQFVENSGVLDAIANSLQNCQNSYTENIGNSIEKGSTVIKNLEYEKTMQVISQPASSEAVISQLQLLFNIQENVVRQETEELQMIESELLSKVESKFKEGISKGAGEGYKVAVANGVSQAAVEQTLNQQKTELNTVLQELEFVITAQTKRQAPQDALNGIYDRLDSISGLKTLAKKDAFQTKAVESIEEYRIWLTERARAIIMENQELASQMDKLELDKEELTAQLQQALDENDLALAKKKQAMIELLDEQMKKKQQELTNIMEDPESSESDKAKAENQSGSATVLNNINQIKQEALSALAEGKENISDQLNALTELGAEAALKEIAQKASETGKEQVAEQASQAANDSQNSSLYGALEGGGASMEELRVIQKLEEFFGMAFEELDGKKQAELLVVLDWLIEEGYISLESLFLRYYEAARESLPDFDKIKRQEQEYVPLLTLAQLIDYRYVFEDSGKEVTLSKGSKAYKFKANSSKMECYPKKEESLKKNVLYQKDLYLYEEDAGNYFGCQIEYLEKTEKGICLTAKMYREAEEFYQLLKEGEE